MSKLENNAKVELAKVLSKPEANENDIQMAVTGLAEQIQNKVLAEAQAVQGDNAVLASRGTTALTGEERKYFMEMIESGTAFDNVGATVPATLINRVFDDLVKNHPIIGAVDTMNGGLTTEWIFSIGVNPAFWGTLCADVKELVDKGFRKISIGQFKLSAFIPVCKAFLDLNSPEWLAQYVVTVLTESIAIALENAIVDGTGKEMPIGIRRSLANVASGEHTVITATEVEGFTPAVMGTMMAELSKVTVETGVTVERSLAPSEVTILVNPQTYYKVLFPEYTVQNSLGQYVSALPLPFNIVQTTAVPEGEFVIGRMKDYLFVLGAGVKLGFSDEHRYIQDERVYLAKMYGNGQPKGDGMFKRVTIAPAVPETANAK